MCLTDRSASFATAASPAGRGIFPAPRSTSSGLRLHRSAMRVSVRSVLQPVTNTSGSSTSQVTAAVSGTPDESITSMMASSCGV